jgi:transposase
LVVTWKEMPRSPGHVFYDRLQGALIRLPFASTGVVLVANRLEHGQFRWPKVHDGVMRLSAAQLQALLEGLDWRRVHAPRRTVVPSAAG